MKIDVLDRGSVELLDKMGSDLTTVESARVSFLKGATELGEREARLVKYLAEHEHTSPFRHAQLMFRFKAPLFCARQLWKHIVGITPEFDLEDQFTGFSGGFKDTGWNEACLTGDTEITFLQGGIRVSPYKLRLDQIVEMWQVPWRRERLQRRPLRVLNEQNGAFETSYVKEVYERGVQDVYEVVFSNNKRLRCTASHRFLTDKGWMTLGSALELQCLSNGVVAFRTDRKFVANGLPVAGNGKYRDREWMEEQRKQGRSVQEIADLAECTYHTVRKWLRIHNLKFAPEETYFKPGQRPWNVGKRYKFGPNPFSPELLAKVRKARSGAASNFWKGGVTPERKNIERWTTEQGPNVHAKFDYTCQQCGKRGGKLHSHHIIPVWYDATKARDFDNLVSLCHECHRRIHTENRELEFAEAYLGDNQITIDHSRQPKKASPRRVVPHLVDVVNVTYIGKLPTYDIEVETHHNFVANGMVVHNSGRYVELQDEFYIPEIWRAQSASNKQGSAGPLAEQTGAAEAYRQGLEAAYAAYQRMRELGVAKEQARIVLPQSIYTQWIWTGSLQAFLHVVDLRTKPDAQWETQQYGLAVQTILAEYFPVCLEKWEQRKH
ncbi:MAG TPA: FAD-dependent thymidylate synthase [Herpetosiphonaceae bacterium]